MDHSEPYTLIQLGTDRAVSTHLEMTIRLFISKKGYNSTFVCLG